MASKIIILSMIATVAMAATAAVQEPIAILSQTQESSPDGSFQTNFETENGITFEEHGVLKNAGAENEAEEVHGSASWTAPDGTKVNLGWAADENGSRFEGSHLPTPPPTEAIPLAIQRSLDWIATHPQPEEKNKN